MLPWNEKTLAFDVHCLMVEIPFHIRHRDGLNLSQPRAGLSLRPRNQDHPQSAEEHQVCLQFLTSPMDMSGSNSSAGRLRTGEREIKAFLFRYRACHSSIIRHARMANCSPSTIRVLLFVAQALDRIQLRRLARGVVTKQDSNTSGEQSSDDEYFWGEFGGKLKEVFHRH